MGQNHIRSFLLLCSLVVFPVYGQSNIGELRLTIIDPSGLGTKTSVELICEANQFRHAYVTDDAGALIVKRLPFGLYRLRAQPSGFAELVNAIEIRSAVPLEFSLQLALLQSKDSVVVKESDTLIDSHRAGTANRIGADMIENRIGSLPGRSLQDLVNSQPGWLYEGNAVLHPRGSEYQTQLVVDGIPLTDNRSPSFAPEIQADDLESMNIYTASFPPEYGRKMGGVVELNTAKDTRDGFHGEVVLSGGSFETAGAFVLGQYVRGKNALEVSASGDRTDHYLNPVVPQNYTNRATTGAFSIRYERDLTTHDRFSISLRHELSRYEIPNEQVQEAAGQLQNADNFETMGIASYQHIFSPNFITDLRGMVRDNSNDFSSNQESTPIIAFQHNHFREGYFKGSVSIHKGRQEWKAGVESDATFVHENFSDRITDFTNFDPGTPASFAFIGNRPDLEQSAFVQDQIRMGKWTVSAGLRWDHYQLVVNQNAVSPRLSVARYIPSLNLVVHVSYDRIFQTPAFENILLSSSSQVQSLDPLVLHLPVEPSHGNYFEAGVAKSLFGQLRFEANVFDRRVSNYADDDQLLSTAVSFPIAFAKAYIYGAESKLEIPHWNRFSGFLSYSYIVGTAYLPVTGGLFLGDDASNALSQTSGRFWDSQDQRNTARTRIRYEFTNRLWAGLGAEYGSGLPFEFSGTPQQALAQYGQSVVDRVNFSTGRVRPSLSVDLSLGAEIWKSEKAEMRLQVDVTNLNNRLNVIDFAGLFSGNAIAPPRSYSLRLQTSF
jgi:outer membrane cobalamin receptor